MPFVEFDQDKIIGNHRHYRSDDQMPLTETGASGDENQDIEQVKGADRLAGDKNGQTDGDDIETEREVTTGWPAWSTGHADQKHDIRDQIKCEQGQIIGDIDPIIAGQGSESDIDRAEQTRRNADHRRLKFRVIAERGREADMFAKPHSQSIHEHPRPRPD
ncbi:hypothetical protein [uncultured Thiocystis sp.]|uniref:hypothetical protein n=1 Tax=uncultured Thiocystis sp. TaxID=1202134 RepID=UPI0025DD6E90|nr:hypothetical protein [uncultured Thiocystis sp.]